MDSILQSTKKLLGIGSDYTQFDQDIMMHINSVFLTLNELGIGPEDGFQLTDENTEWAEFIYDNPLLLGAVKTYMHLKVRMLFDPPTNSALIEAMKANIAELEWRMNVLVDPKSENGLGIQNG